MASLSATPANPNINKIVEWVFLIILLLFNSLYTNNLSPHQQCIPGINPHDPTSDCGYSNIISTNPELGYPVRVSTVSFTSVVVLGPVIWVLILIANVIFVFYMNKDLMDRKQLYRIMALKCEIMLRSVFFSVVINEVITTTIKVSVGRPRPNYLLNDDELDRTRSFPSGHTSYSFSIFFLMTLYLLRALLSARENIFTQQSLESTNGDNASKRSSQSLMNDVPNSDVPLKVEDMQKEAEEALDPMKEFTNPMNGDSYWGIGLVYVLKYVQILWMLIAVTPTLVAIYIGCTRLTDYKHHYSDVLGGAVIGIACSVLSYLYYHSEFYIKG